MKVPLEFTEGFLWRVQDRTWLSLIGFTSGVLVSIANVLQFLGGEAAGRILLFHVSLYTKDIRAVIVIPSSLSNSLSS